MQISRGLKIIIQIILKNLWEMGNITLINIFEEELYTDIVFYMKQLFKIIVLNDDIYSQIFFTFKQDGIITKRKLSSSKTIIQ